MVTIGILPTVREHDQTHDPAACCWLCAMPHEDKVWWAELRGRRGIGEPPYMMRRWRHQFENAVRRN